MMRVVEAIQMSTSSGETTLSYRNQRGQVVTVTGVKERTSDLFHALLSAEMEKENKDAAH